MINVALCFVKGGDVVQQMEAYGRWFCSDLTGVFVALMILIWWFIMVIIFVFFSVCLSCFISLWMYIRDSSVCLIENVMNKAWMLIGEMCVGTWFYFLEGDILIQFILDMFRLKANNLLQGFVKMSNREIMGNLDYLSHFLFEHQLD